jgi:universal stress protein A
MAENAQARVRDALNKVGTSGEIRVPYGPAAATILYAARDRNCGLIVTGSRGRTGLARFLLGGVAETVAHEALCSVLVTRLHATAK